MHAMYPHRPTLAAHPLRSVMRVALARAVCCCVPIASLLAQGVTTAALHGTVHSSDGAGIDGTRVVVVNTATGFVALADVRRGRFLVQGLEIGGPYSITIRRPGYQPERREGVFLALGERLELHFVLQPAALALDTLRIAAVPPFSETSADGGTGATMTDSLFQRLPTLNRNLYDFVRLVPQVSTRTGFRAGFSGGGEGLRFNNYLINGTPQREAFFNATPEFGGGKSLPLDAVKQYQVLLAPYDVRYGDFAGALVNTVTRSGTNHLAGSVFAYARNDRLARRDAVVSTAPYERLQYGLSLGGPVLRDRLHFFVASELQRFTWPAFGPYVGQPTSASRPIPVSEADLTRLEDLLRAKGMQAGSGGPVENRNPLANVFVRLDFAAPAWNSRAVLWSNHARFSATTFARSAPRDSFPLSTYQWESASEKRETSVQILTTLPRLGAGHNELVISHNSGASDGRSDVRQPIVRVSVPSPLGGKVMLVTGTHPAAQGIVTRSRTIHIGDNVTLPVGANQMLSLGATAEQIRVDPGGLSGSYGTWTFASLDALDRGVADRFEIVRDVGTASVPYRASQYSVYVGDQWYAGERITITIGVRADVVAPSGHAPYVSEVDSIFHRRTDAMPHRPVHWSPRAGFTWDVSGTGRDRLRGGVGIFTGRPPAVWIHSSRANYGLGARLTCGTRPGDSGPPPPFVPDYRKQPAACASASEPDTGPRGDVELLDPKSQLTRSMRASLAWDRRLPWDLLATGEALVTRNLADFVFANLNLRGPQALDRNGRVLYGMIDTMGNANPALRSQFPSVIDLTTIAHNHAYQLSVRLERQFARRAAATASYTYSRVRDVSTPVRTGVRGFVNWSARAVSGLHDDMRPGISLNDVPHRITLAGSYRAPWRRWSTDFSLYYVGESGSPFTYVAGGAGPLGDLNADGSDVNDPIYVPRNAYDTTEIVFAPFERQVPVPGGGTRTDTVTVPQQTQGFERFIQRAPCLRRQRGRIMQRNSCREPLTHTTVASVRQTLPIANRTLEADVQVFNLLNLLRNDWGLFRVAHGRTDLTASPSLLEQFGQTRGQAGTTQPVFRFDVTAPRWDVQAESAFQLQFALRYRF